MAYLCNRCGVLWSLFKIGKPMLASKRPKKICPDCKKEN